MIKVYNHVFITSVKPQDCKSHLLLAWEPLVNLISPEKIK